QEEFSLATAVVARVAIAAGEAAMTLASAGHPLPLRHRLGGAPVEAGTSGILLGLDATGAWPERTVHVATGDTLLFYTDGVTDTPGRRGRFGETRLRTVLRGCPQEPEELLEAIDRALAEFRSGESLDDVAMLAVLLLQEAAPAGRTPAEAEPAFESLVFK